MLEIEQRHRQLLLVPVQARRDERPGLVQHEGHRETDGEHQRELERHRERRDHAGRDQGRAGRQLLLQRLGDEVNSWFM